MGAEYFEIDRNKILSLIEKERFSHRQLARRLNVSNKTIQRLINGTTKRIRSNQLKALADIFSVTPSELVRSDSQFTRANTINKLIQNLTSDDFFQRVHAEVGWARYNEVLRDITLADLPNHQEVQVLRMLGVSYIYLGNPQSAKPYLVSALHKARPLNENARLVEVFIWISVLEDALGNLKTALEYLEEAGAYIDNSVPSNISAAYYLIKGRVLLNCERFGESEFNIRRAIALATKNRKRNRIRISLFYSYLGWLYLRQREYVKAHSAFKRAGEFAKRSGATKGIAISELAIGVIDWIQSKNNQLSGRTAFVASKVNELSESTAVDIRFEQLMFVCKAMKGDFDEAAEVLSKRKKIVKNCPLLLARVVLDSLFLEKLGNNSRKSVALNHPMIERARTIFKENSLLISLDVLDWLVSSPQIELNEFLERYPFG